MSRREELEARLQQVRQRVERACAQTGRDPGEVEVVAVTKHFPARDIDLLAGLGVRSVAENRDQEAAAKLADVARREDLTVHFVGQLQSKKASSVLRYADVVQSVDRRRLVEALERAAERRERALDVLVQVSLDGDPSRGGVPVAHAGALADEVAQTRHLRLRGVMAVAPLGGDPARAFAVLREVADGIRRSHPGAVWVSAGMSADLEAAVAHGATHLRVGSAILGSRPPLR
jgi:pyridoxal phosphate enzyme (YggS family)